MLSERAIEYSQAEFQLYARASLLDFGAGTGLAAMAALARPDCAVKRLLGIDVSPDMIAVFQKKIDVYTGAADVAARVAELTGPEALDGETFDAAVSMLVFHHLEDIRPSLRALRAVLRPGGMLLVWDFEATENAADFHPKERHPGVHHHGFSIDALKAAMMECGFARTDVRRAFQFEKEGSTFIMVCAAAFVE